MHRAGTSLLANLLFELGVPGGDPAGFLPADRWNPRGYFEQLDVLDLNNTALTGQPYSLAGWRRRLGQLRYLAFAPMSMLRSFWRGAGMVLGMVSYLLSRRSRRASCDTPGTGDHPGH